jgi:predicted RNase H-like HicB family nuclease
LRREYIVVIEKDKAGYFIGTVPQLRGCDTQDKSLDELMERTKEAIQVCLEVESYAGEDKPQFVGVQRMSV